MPRALIETLRADPTGDPWASFSAALAFVHAGVPVLPLQPGAKRPVTQKRGGRARNVPATCDPERVRDFWLGEPSLNVGLAPNASYVIVDVDPDKSGSLERVESLGLPIDGYRERSARGGWHLPLMMPAGVRATGSATIGGIEFKGPGKLAVAPHSLFEGGRYRVEPGRDVWTWPMIPAEWPDLHRLTRSRSASVHSATDEDEAVATHIIARLRAGTYGEGVAALFTDAWRREHPAWTESERDYALTFAATHFSDDPHILTALLEVTGWPHDLHRDHPRRDPDAYVARTVCDALGARHTRNLARLSAIADVIAPPGTAGPLLPNDPRTDPHPDHRQRSSSLPGARNVIVWTLPDGSLHDDGMMGVVVAVQRWLCVPMLPVAMRRTYQRAGGWRRIPCSDLAELLAVHPRTISRHLKRMADAGSIVRRVVCPDSDKGPRRDSFARWIGGDR